MKLSIIALTGALILGLAADTFAQRQEFKIKNIRRSATQAPNYSASGGDLGGRGPSLAQQWYKIEVQFSSDPDWADDVQLKYYVLVSTGREQRLFTGDVTHINVAKGSTHYSAVFLHPNTLKRYGPVEAVAVQLFYRGALQDQVSDPQTQQRWWERLTPVTGYVLAPPDTPWAMIGTERFEAIKPRQ